jgi:hypothetical protein
MESIPTTEVGMSTIDQEMVLAHWRYDRHLRRGSRRPGEGDVIAHFASSEAILRYSPAPPMVGTTGEIEALSLWAGQSVALARRPQPAAEMVAELVSRL